jgi:proton glutamate symport protein
MTSAGRGLLTLVGLVGGGILGLVLPAIASEALELAVAVCQPVGRLWLSALQMTVMPLVAAVLLSGVAEVANVAQTGRLARRTLAWIGSLSMAAAALAIMLARAAFSWLPRSPESAALPTAAAVPAAVAESQATDWLARMPDNVFAAAAGNMMAVVVVFTLLFAAALTRLEPHRRLPVIELARSVAATMVVLIGWILAAAPVGVFALALPLAAVTRGRALGHLGGYVAVLIGVYVAITAAVYGIAWTRCGGLRRFAVAALPAQGVAAGTQSSLASLPAMLEAAREMGCPAATRGLVLPLAVSLFRIMSPAQYLVVAEFIAWQQGIELGWDRLFMLVPLAVVISLGAVGLPGQASFMGTTLPVVQAAGLPVEPLGLLLAVDVIPDVAATVGNVTADLALAAGMAQDAPVPRSPEPPS